MSLFKQMYYVTRFASRFHINRVLVWNPSFWPPLTASAHPAEASSRDLFGILYEPRSDSFSISSSVVLAGSCSFAVQPAAPPPLSSASIRGLALPLSDEWRNADCLLRSRGSCTSGSQIQQKKAPRTIQTQNPKRKKAMYLGCGDLT